MFKLVGSTILRKDVDYHVQQQCDEVFLDCTNNDCDQKVKRNHFRDHINEECEYRIIECEFKHYGCDVRGIKAMEMDKHLDDYKFEHFTQKFNFVSNKV